MKYSPSHRAVLALICGAVLLVCASLWRSLPDTVSRFSGGPISSPTNTVPDSTPTGIEDLKGRADGSNQAAAPLFAVSGPTTGERLVPKSDRAARKPQNQSPETGRVTPVDPASFGALTKVTEGDTVIIPIADGEQVQGTVNLVKQDNGYLRVAGSVQSREGGSFSVSTNGKEVAGLIQLHGQQLAYRVEQPTQGEVIVREMQRGDVVCLPLPHMENEKVASRARSPEEAPLS